MYIHVKEEKMINKVFETGFDVLNKVSETQQEQLDQAAKLIADCFLAHKTFYVTGSGHSHTLCEEFYGRAGGLAFVVPIMTSELTMTEHPTKSSFLERLSGYAAILADLYDIEEGDVVLIASNSGRNGDCAVQMEGVAAAVCPTSSMANTFIAQAISVQCAYYIKEKGVTPPVFVSLNSEGTEHVNDEYFEKYTRMYKKARL